jgi:acetyl-CoA carboxylase carboxyltransferase component
MTRASYMFITGPEVVREVTNEKVNFDELGGARIQTKKVELLTSLQKTNMNAS